MAARSGRWGRTTLDRHLEELITGAPRTELQRMVLEHDWSRTPLGPQEEWSPTLSAAVSTALNSRFPFLLMWGPELVMVYNDDYAPMLGARHPEALGRPAPEVWADIWADLEAMVAEVMGGRATYSEDLPLVMHRHGFEEETYFSFSFSPVVEPGGRVVGLLDTVVETTHRVLAARRLSVLQRLGSLPRASHGDTAEAVATALGVLADAGADCPLGLVYLVDGDDDTPRLVAGHGVAVEEELATDVLAERVRWAVATGRPQTVTGLSTLLPGLSSSAGPAGRSDVDTAVVLPLTAAGAEQPIGALVLGASPRLPLDEDYRIFMALAAGQVAATVADAQAVAAERRRAEERARSDQARAQFFTDVAVTLQRAVLGPTVLPGGFAVHYEPATGTLEVGGDWYDVVELSDGAYGVVVGDVVGRGLAAAAVMGQLRSAGRALLLESRSPGHVLSALDGFAALIPGAAVSTVFCAIIDPFTGRLRYSSAGHPPAVLVDVDGGVRLLEEGSALPLAVAHRGERPESEVLLPPGSTLLLYTDGLVERRDEALDEGIGRAADALVEGQHLGPAELSALLTERLLGDAPDDDVAFVLYRCG
ncbi:SpoIIE family protein phosphatase [Blastococcus saxobsidens]|uniref:Serine phosphatase RsbU (Regulator of sigma subunit) n=1 Tax=Blastococcus saxobsidens TaxID=138336 RepID=A0A4Q7YBG8_9ACTN|nr:SpoIIE family protein phosphatase [Blastococcus saxobsidens]RZU33934.1 serine phosphatase RsbU (regulator of sigma subunit) [Blastococcus saxobsidens]